MPKLFSIRPTLTIRGRTFNGIRGWAGKPTHPPLTDFPIVCYVLAAVFDVVSYIAGAGIVTQRGRARLQPWPRCSSSWRGRSCRSGPRSPASGTGGRACRRDSSTGFIGRAEHTQVWRTANWHMTVMLTVTAIVIADIVVRSAQLDDQATGALVMVLSIVAAGLVALGAAYGGALVFEYQFNVQPLKGSTAWNETEEDQCPAPSRPRAEASGPQSLFGAACSSACGVRKPSRRSVGIRSRSRRIKRSPNNR